MVVVVNTQQSCHLPWFGSFPVVLLFFPMKEISKVQCIFCASVELNNTDICLAVKLFQLQRNDSFIGLIV